MCGTEKDQQLQLLSEKKAETGELKSELSIVESEGQEWEMTVESLGTEKLCGFCNRRFLNQFLGPHSERSPVLVKLSSPITAQEEVTEKCSQLLQCLHAWMCAFRCYVFNEVYFIQVSLKDVSIVEQEELLMKPKAVEDIVKGGAFRRCMSIEGGRTNLCDA